MQRIRPLGYCAPQKLTDSFDTLPMDYSARAVLLKCYLALRLPLFTAILCKSALCAQVQTLLRFMLSIALKVAKPYIHDWQLKPRTFGVLRWNSNSLSSNLHQILAPRYISESDLSFSSKELLQRKKNKHVALATLQCSPNISRLQRRLTTM